jgi:copper transport protein
VIERRRSGAERIHRLIGGVVLGVICVAALSGGAVSAHAEVIDVVPASGSIVSTAPDDVLVTFSERVSINGGSVELFDDTGTSIPVDASIVDDTVVVALPDDLANGTYLVAWRVISADSHPVTGTSTFSVGAVSTAAPVDVGDRLPAGVAFWRVGAMTATYAGVLVAIGVAWFSRYWRSRDIQLDGSGPSIDAGAVAALDRVAVIACVVGIVGLLVALPARLVTVGGGWSSLSDTGFVADTLGGPIGVATIVSIVGLIGVLLWRRGTARSSTLVSAVCSLLAVGGFAFEGHTRTKDPMWLMVLSDVTHLSAGSVWVGGVVALGLVLRRTTGAARARMVLDVSSAALLAVVAVSAAGTAMSVMVLPSFNALADTGYGLALMVKVALVIGLLALGLRNRLVLVPAIERSGVHPVADTRDPETTGIAVSGLWRSVVGELALFALVLVATGTLVGRSPVVASQEASGATPSVGDAGFDVTTDTGTGPNADPALLVPVTMALSSGAGSVVVEITPGVVGTNAISLMLIATDGSALAVVEPPTVELRERSREIGPLTFEAVDVGGGRWEVAADIPFAGTWELSVGARTGTFDSGDARTEFVIDT